MCCPRGRTGGCVTSSGSRFSSGSPRSSGRSTGWQTVRNAWVLLSGILETAVEYGYLQTNPARGVKFPQKALKEKPAMIAGDEPREAARRSSTNRIGRWCSLIAATGLRIGELLALRWSALDLEVGTLAVRESVFEGKFQPPKTQKALRTIPLGPHAVAALTAHRARVSRRAAGRSRVRQSQGRSVAGVEAAHATCCSRQRRRQGSGRVTWHQFRHIHSSLLNDLRVPAKIAQEQLGHASISTTLNIYTHVVDASHRNAVEAVEERLFGECAPNAPKSADALETAAPASDSVN